MKKTLLFIIAIVLVASLALVMFACGGNDNGGNNGGNNNGNSGHTHKYGDWKTVKEATCTEAGSREQVCSCGDKKTETIPALGHKDANGDGKCDKCGAEVGSQGGEQGGQGGEGGEQGGQGGEQGGQGGEQGEATKLTVADLQKSENAKKLTTVTELANYVSQYITNHAIDEVDNTANINAALAAKIEASAPDANADPSKVYYSQVVTSVVATLKNGSYELQYNFKGDNTYYVYSNPEYLEAKAKVAGNYVGAAQVEMTKQNKSEFKSGMAEVYNALIRTINQAIEDGTDFGNLYIDKDGDAVFGGKVGASFAFNYGEMEEPITFGLYVEGKIGRIAAHTNVKVEVKNENDGTVVFGLYYQGAEQAKDCKLSLSVEFGDYKHDVYLDNADINAIVNYYLDDYFSDEKAAEREHNCDHEVVEDDHCKACGKYICQHVDEKPADCICDKCGESMHVDANGDNACDKCKKTISMLVLPYDKKTQSYGYTSFGAVLKDMGLDMGTTIVTVVNKLTTGTITKNADGSVTYQYYLDIEGLINDLLGDPLISSALEDLNLEEITSQIEFLKDFDLASFTGVGGVLMFTFDLTAEKGGYITGAEISYNVAERDFRWSKRDDTPKTYGPVNVAIAVKDLVIDSTVDDIDLKDGATYTYFNPLNGEITADVKVTEVKGETKKESEYKLDAKASFNPFEIALANILDEGKLSGGAEFILKEKNGDETPVYVWIHDVKCTDGSWDSTVDVLLNGKYYTTFASESDFFSKQVWPYLVDLTENQSIASDITKYVKELVAQFSSEDTRGDKEFAELKQALSTSIEALAAGDGSTSAILDGIKRDAISAIAALDWKKFESYAVAADKANEIAAKAASDFAKQVVWENRSGIGAFDGMNIITIATSAGDWIDALKAGSIPVLDDKGNVVKYVDFMSFSLGSLFDSLLGLDMTADNGEAYLTMELNAEVYNALMDMLRVAIPNLPTFDQDAAEVTVHINDGKYNNKLEVIVTYKDVKVVVEGDMNEFFDVEEDEEIDELIYSVNPNGLITSKVTVTIDTNQYVFDGKVQLVDWLTEEGEVNTDSGKIVATLDVDMNGKAYAYRGTLMLSKAEETENQIFTVTFEEKDGAVADYQQFIKAELETMDNEFDLTLTLAARGGEGALLEDHVYTIVGKYLGDSTVSLEIAGGNEKDSDVFGLTLGAKWNGINEAGYMPLSISDPSVGVTVGVKYNDNSVLVEVDNLTIASWTQEVTVSGFETNGLTKAAEGAKATDAALFADILALVQPYLGGVAK